MASRHDLATDGFSRLMQSRFVRDLPLVIVGCAIGALAIDMFMVPNGLAAGGMTGLATIIAELGRRAGVELPIGLQTIVMNAVLMVWVARTGGVRYVVQTVTGFVLFGIFADLFAPFVVPLHDTDLMLPALWGGSPEDPLACHLGPLWISFEFFALLALPLIFFRTRTGLRIPKWFFYGYYPAHLLAIFLVRTLLHI